MVIDTETTDLHGEIIQVAVVDLAGTVLLDTLVRPSTPIAPAASLVHGMVDSDVATAPSLADVAPALAEVTRGRLLLAYNAPYDYGVIENGLRAAGLDPAHLARARSWHCLMRARRRREGTGSFVRLGGNHQAVGDCLAALTVLHEIAK